MLTVDHFKRPFIDDILESVKVIDEFDQDINEHNILYSNNCIV